jgi:hypothetical protein
MCVNTCTTTRDSRFLAQSLGFHLSITHSIAADHDFPLEMYGERLQIYCEYIPCILAEMVCLST